MRQYPVIAKRTARIDGLAKAPGDAAFTTDIYMPNMLWVEVQQSSYPQARTLSIDTEKAKKRMDVKVIITPDDVHDA